MIACTILVEGHQSNIPAMVYDIMKAWIILVEGHQSNIPAKLIELGPTVSYEKIFKVFYIDI